MWIFPTSGPAYCFWYVQSLNCFYSTYDGTTVPKSHKGMPFIQMASGIETNSSFKVTNIDFETVDGLLTSNANNLSSIGRSYLSGLGMPSGRYIDLTLGASGSTYTAPANGWFVLWRVCNVSDSFAGLYGQVRSIFSGDANKEFAIYIPVKRGEVIPCYYNNLKTGQTNDMFLFVYAEGEN